MGDIGGRKDGRKDGHPVDNVKAHVVVQGRVQGVCFRAATRDMARELELAGWVRNLSTGEVEASFEGPRETVEQAVAWCRRGPAAALVTGCEVSWHAAEGAAAPFEVRYR
jgi:acylphosphatase